MYRFPRILASRWLPATLCVLLLAGATSAAQVVPRPASVRAVKVLGSKDAVEIEVEASESLIPQTRVLTGPDRFVVDFPNAVPSLGVHNQAVNRGEVRGVRVGLFQSQPPITRVVLDLKTAQSYQVFPNGRTVMIKVTSGALEASIDVDDTATGAPARPGLVVTNYTPGAQRVPSEATLRPGTVEVSFRNGLLGIRANKATLSEVLNAVQQRTGADIGMLAGADQEKVVVNLGPAPAPEVLAALLNGSRFNYLILSAANNPQQLERVILTPRGAMLMPLPVQQNLDTAEDEAPRPAPVEPAVANVPPNMPPPNNAPETRAGENDASDQ